MILHFLIFCTPILQTPREFSLHIFLGAVVAVALNPSQVLIPILPRRIFFLSNKFSIAARKHARTVMCGRLRGEVERSGMAMELFLCLTTATNLPSSPYNNLKFYPKFQDTKRYSVIAVQCVASAADGSCTHHHARTTHTLTSIQTRTRILRFRFVS